MGYAQNSEIMRRESPPDDKDGGMSKAFRRFSVRQDPGLETEPDVCDRIWKTGITGLKKENAIMKKMKLQNWIVCLCTIKKYSKI